MGNIFKWWNIYTKRISNFDLVQEINNIKIDYAKYKQAILNQVNNNRETISVDVENRKNIDQFIKKFDNHPMIGSIKENTHQLDKRLGLYGVSIKQRDEKLILTYSNEIEHILDELFAQLNSMKN